MGEVGLGRESGSRSCKRASPIGFAGADGWLSASVNVSGIGVLPVSVIGRGEDACRLCTDVLSASRDCISLRVDRVNGDSKGSEFTANQEI